METAEIIDKMNKKRSADVVFFFASRPFSEHKEKASQSLDCEVLYLMGP
jgi:hypothetical protein